MTRIDLALLLFAAGGLIASTGCHDDDDPLGVVCDPPTTVSYADQGTFQTPSLSVGGVTVTGSASVNVLGLNGLGIVGGLNDNTIDGAEWIRFDLDAPSAIEVSYFVPSAGNQDGDGLVGEATIEAFDPSGTSLGSVPVDGSGTIDVSALFGDVPIGSIVVTANVDNHRIREFGYTPCQ